MRPLERRLMFDAAAVAAIADAVLHLDAQDIDADGNTGNQPADNDLIGTWNDDAGADNAPDASGGNRPSYDEDAFGVGRGGVLFDGNDELTFSSSAEIDAGTFNEKSFAVLFKTSNDTSGHQVIYEQGNNQRGYSISIVDGNLYAYTWNTQEWASGEQHKVINLGAVSTDTTYNVIAVHDATGPNTWSANVNGGAFTTLNNVAAQENHSGFSAVGGTQNPTLNPVDQSNSSNANFTGAVAEIYSWNHALTTQESTDVYNYMNDKWVGTNAAPTIDTNIGVTGDEGATIAITTTQLDTSDVDTADTALTYTITSAPTNGQLELTTNAGVAITSFTQQNLIDGIVVFVHDSSDTTTDSFNFDLDDGSTTLATDTFNITINPVDDGNGSTGNEPVINLPPPVEPTENNPTEATQDVFETDETENEELEAKTELLRTVLSESRITVPGLPEPNLNQIIREGSTQEAENAATSLSRDLEDFNFDESNDDSEIQDLYNELKDTLDDSGLDLTYEEFWSLIQGLQGDVETNIIVEPSPNLSDQLSQEQTNFNNRVEDFLGSL